MAQMGHAWVDTSFLASWAMTTAGLRPARTLCSAALVLSAALIGLAPASLAGPPAATATPVAAVGAASAPTRAATTLDDRALTLSKGKKGAKDWAKVKSPKAYAKTLSRGLRKKATATTKVAATNGGTVTFQAGPGRGTAKITVGGKAVATVKTSNKKTKATTVAFTGAGVVEITVAKARKGVYLDRVDLAGGTTTVPPTTQPTTQGPINTGPLSMVSTSAGGLGSLSNEGISAAAMSPNGLYVAFWARADDLVPGVSDGRFHLYLKTLATGAIRVLDATQAGVLSTDSQPEANRTIAWRPDSSEVLFSSWDPNLTAAPANKIQAPYLYSKSVVDGSIGWLAAGVTSFASWSGTNATQIAFVTSATSTYCSIIPGCTGASGPAAVLITITNGSDSYQGISTTASGSLRAADEIAFSPDGTRIAFSSTATDLVPGDTNAANDVFVKTLGTAQVQRVSTDAGGGQANAESSYPEWSPDSTRVAFSSRATNLAPGDINGGEWDVFAKNVASGAVTPVSVDVNGAFQITGGNYSGSLRPKWSPDGTRIAFGSTSYSLIACQCDTNNGSDVYVKNLLTGRLQLVDATAAGQLANSDTSVFHARGQGGVWGPDGHSLMFLSQATNLAPAGVDRNAFARDVFVKGGL